MNVVGNLPLRTDNYRDLSLTIFFSIHGNELFSHRREVGVCKLPVWEIEGDEARKAEGKDLSDYKTQSRLT